MPVAVLESPSAVVRYTPDDLFRLADGGRGYELVDGELVEQNVSYLSTWVAGELHFHLRSHVGPRRLGWVSPEGTSFRCFPDEPDKVRRADTAFHRLDRLTAAQATTQGHMLVCPDLVVEVVSPNDLAEDVNAKRRDWLAAGAQLVWVVFPVDHELYAHTPTGTVRLFRRGDTLTADPLLPEFGVPVADLFALPVP